VSMTINPTAWILLAMYIALAEARGLDLNRLSGTVQADILKEYIAQKEWIFPIRPSMRLMRDMIVFTAERMARYNPVNISGYHISEAGANAVQEVAFTMANGIAYVEEVTRAGVPVDAFASRLAFYFIAQADFFEEAAKFRAARRLWARLARERFGADDATARLRFHTQTGGVTLQARQPMNNIVRVAYQALAAVLGGTQSLHTNGYDEALALPTEDSATLALRTQQVLGYESGLAGVVDPLGGSWYVEALTDRIEREARALVEEVDRLGGAARAIERGFYQEAIARSAYAQQQAQEAGRLSVVGVNRFTDDSAPPAIEVPDFPELEARQRARLAEARARRDAALVGRALAGVGAAAAGTGPLMPPILDAVRARATLGEISDTLRTEWGTYRPLAG
jgi:methylmalonyl-CoA mutase, N-terminal domain